MDAADVKLPPPNIVDMPGVWFNQMEAYLTVRICKLFKIPPSPWANSGHRSCWRRCNSSAWKKTKRAASSER